MERLTNQWGDNHAVPTKINLDFIFGLDDATTQGLTEIFDRLAAYEDTGMWTEEVQALADAKQAGRLVVLPCKVGDTVYIYSKERGIRTEKVRTFFLGHPSYRVEDRNMKMVRTETCDIPFSELGTRLFLTREEAEAALKGETHETDSF